MILENTWNTTDSSSNPLKSSQKHFPNLMLTFDLATSEPWPWWEHLIFSFVFFIWKFQLFIFFVLSFSLSIVLFIFIILRVAGKAKAKSGVSGHWHLPSNPFTLSTFHCTTWPFKHTQFLGNLEPICPRRLRGMVNNMWCTNVYSNPVYTLHCTIYQPSVWVKKSRNRESLLKGDSRVSRLLQFSM